ncbi:phosphatidylethanolamine N-methyltransferase isoform X3 [Suricata suricatta]|uniref:Phosphatidylethanolamine N-methyltransferase n=1 Tax=Suricata suricatta TaxID=37032 RepID=A0A673UV32_SURSU|nr:phosphatidylethanolamine N-methyltransferase isoform X3 [Suricata suricatta]
MAVRWMQGGSRLSADLCVMTWLLGYVDPSDPGFVAAILIITFNPLFWNVVARWEHRTRKLSKAFRSPYLACYSLGAAILLLNILRSHCFTQAMLSQPKMESLDNPTAYCLGLALLGIGSTFVLSSFFALGFTGTFLGDYFGILMEARVTTFPFNILDNPMYWGSTANYLGWAIICVLCAQMRPPKAELTCGPCLRPSGGARCPGVRCHQARQPHRPAADRGRGPHLHSRHPVRGALHRSDLPAESLPVPQEELTAPVATSLRACCPRPAPSARPCSGEKGAWPPLGVRARCGPLSALETSALGALDMPLFGHRALVSRCPQHTLTPQ